MRLIFLLLYISTQTISTRAIADVYITIEQADEVLISSHVSGQSHYIQIEEPSLHTISQKAKQLPYQNEVIKAANVTEIEPALIHAVIAAESNHQTHARSSKGAVGLMQLMPATAQRFNVSNRFDPQQNIMAGAKYLSELRNKFNGDLSLTLAAYNAGPSAIKKYGGSIPPYAETQKYVPKVIKLYQGYSEVY